VVTSKRGNYFILKFLNLKRITNPGEFGTIYEMFVKRAKAFDEAASNAVDAELSDESGSPVEV
jgi:hypothetical protein